MKKISFLIIFSFLILPVLSQETQWRGPERNGQFPDTGLMKKWPAGGPEMLLKVEDIGMGYSSPVLHDNIIYVTGKKGEEDFLSAIGMDGKIIYQVKYGSSWNKSYPETRSTPTIDGEKIYVISGIGEVVCLNIDDGTIIWSVDANQLYEGDIHRWGVAESPLIIGDKVLYTCGGNKTSVVALNKYSGEIEWQAESLGGQRTYVSPVLFERDGRQQIVALTAHHVLGINPEDGKIAWHYEYLPPEGAGGRGATNSTNSPITRGDEIFVSKGYDQYGVMLKVSSDMNSVKEKWRSGILDTHHGHYVNVGDYLYGSNWESNSTGNWVCLEWDTGELMYEEKWNTKGSIALAEGLLYCYEERGGNIALVNPTPEKYDIISTFKIEYGSGPHWAHPYIADKKLLIRHGEVVMVFDIADKKG